MSVRLKLSDGQDLVLQANIDEVSEALRSGLNGNEPLRIKTSSGLVLVNPQRVVYVAEEDGDRSPRRALAD